MNKPLKFTDYTVGFHEVPDEVSLLINITGCDLRCEGCHSQHLWAYTGEYLSRGIYALLDRYSEYITCVCFLGGDQNPNEIGALLKTIRNNYSLKTCLYSGLDNVLGVANLLENLDYFKLGCYKQNKGGLQSPTTNQKFYKRIGNEFVDITYRFIRSDNSE